MPQFRFVNDDHEGLTMFDMGRWWNFVPNKMIFGGVWNRVYLPFMAISAGKSYYQLLFFWVYPIFIHTHTHLTVHSTRMCTSLIVRSLTIRFASLISHAKTGIFWFLIEHGGVPWFPEWISWRIFRVIFTTVWRVVFLSIKKLRDFSLQNTINIHKW